MDAPTFRILDTLASDLGKKFSINQLTGKIKEIHGTAYYANIYEKLHDLENNQIIKLTNLGKSSLTSLNFENFLLVDYLAQRELINKISFLETRTNIQLFFQELENQLDNYCFIESIVLIDPLRNFKLNKLELLILTQKDASDVQNETAILLMLQDLEKKFNLKTNCLTLNNQEFFSFLKSDEINPVKELFSNMIVLYGAQTFWRQIRELFNKGIYFQPIERKINTFELDKVDLVFNLARFGYTEFGSKVSQGNKICIEYIITSLLISSDVRRLEAIPVIIAKNSFNYNLLVFLAQKFGQAEKLLGILKTLENIKHIKEVSRAIRLLEILNVKEVMFDKESVLQKLRLYNVF